MRSLVPRRLLAALATLTLAASAMLIPVDQAGASAAGLTASAPGVTPTTIKVGIISDLTGPAASSFDDAPAAIEARFKQINADGGVDGRKIIWTVADTTSSPSGAATAAKALVESDGVFLVAPVSALLFGGTPYLQQAGIPVLGMAVDGPEWYEQPNTNMFAIEGSNCGGTCESDFNDGALFKELGAKKVSFVASNTPSSTSGIAPFVQSMKADGLSVCDNTVVPLGAVDFTAYALSFKTAGCQAVECSCVLSSTLALSTALKQEGLTNVKVSGCCASESVYDSAEDLAAAEGMYFGGYVPDNPAGQAVLAGLKKYDPGYHGGVPSLGQANGWETANLVVEGLEVAGKNPTRASLIANLRKVTDWTDNGLADPPDNFKTFGQPAKELCGWDFQFVNKKYVPFPKSGAAVCESRLPAS